MHSTLSTTQTLSHTHILYTLSLYYALNYITHSQALSHHALTQLHNTLTLDLLDCFEEVEDDKTNKG